MNTLRPVSFILLLFLFFPQFNIAQIITTIAGTGVAGKTGDGGPATAATLNVPTGLAFDNDGNLLITDQENYVVRKLNLSTGIITRIAGTYGVGYHQGDGGPALNATFYGPSGIAVDKTGNIYIAEQYSSIIRKIDAATGIITTFAGSAGQFGYSGDGGLAVYALLDRPIDVEVDGAGNVYIADWENNVIRKINGTTRIITTVAGRSPGMSGYSGDGGPAVNALLYEPARIHLDGAGNLFIADQLNNVIRKVDAATGIISRFIGVQTGGYFGDGGPAINAGLNKPASITMDGSGNIYITDTHNHAIRFVNVSTGVITTIAGNGSSGYTGDGGPAINATFFRPTQILSDAMGNLYIADARNHVIRKISPCPKIFLGKDTSICKSKPIELNAGNKHTSFQWSTGATTQTIRTDIPGTYTVEARNGNNCVAKDTIVIQQHPVTQMNWQKDSVICAGASIVLNTPANATAIQWQDGSTSSSYTIQQPGKYWVALTDQHNCPASDTIVINKTILPPPDFLIDDTTFCSFDAVTLQPMVSFAAHLWSTGSTTSSIEINKAGTYWLQVQDKYNCKWKETIVASHKECKRFIKFPNSFTPNNDGKNDVFKPVVEGNLAFYRMTIFNRWGQKVFETNNWQTGWNGSLQGALQNSGTYVWMITYQLPGAPLKTEKGVLTLLR